MKIALGLTILLFTACKAFAEMPEGQTVETFPWNIILFADPTGTHFSFLHSGTNQTRVTAGVEDASDPNNPLSAPVLIQYNSTAPLQLQFSQWPNEQVSQPLTTHHFAFVGEVRYENVSPGSYLEMWSHFASPAPGYPEQAYFSRTLAESGPMGNLTGTSDWRHFSLPFDATGTTTKLVRLEMNLHLTGPGTIHFRNLKLVQYPDAPMPAGASAPSEDASAPGMQVIADLPFDKDVEETQMGRDAKVTFVSQDDGSRDLVITRSGNDWYTTKLAEIPPELLHKVTASRFGFAGEVKCPQATTVLQMGLGFVPRIPPLPEISEPDSQVDAQGTWRSFEVQFDRGHSGFVLEHLGLWLKFYGSATVQLRRLRLVQYPEAPAGNSTPVATTSSVNPRPPNGIDGKSFWLGVAATGLMLLAATGMIFVSRRWDRRRHERELRRIASLDS